MGDNFELDQEEPISYEIDAPPNRYSFLRDLDLDQDVERRLGLQLDTIVRGNSDVFITPLGKNVPPHTILGLWDRIFKSNIDKMNETLIDLEESNRSKYGPRSIALPWKDRKDSVLSYYRGRAKVYSLNTGVDPLDTLLPNTLNLRPISIDKAIGYLKNDTNSGLPFFTRKKKVKDRLLAKFNYLFDRDDPCILFTRTQEQSKTRNVWGFPIIDTLSEMLYYQPLLSYQRRLNWRSAIVSPERVDIKITDLINEAQSDRDLVLLSIDFSSFDSTVPKRLIDLAFKYIMSLYQPKFWSDIEHLAYRFSTIGIVTPDGVLEGSHGVPSGSTFTNEVDSLAQYFASMSTGFVHPDKCQIQGDDGGYLIRKESVDDFIRQLEGFGFIVNREKSYTSSDYCIYLQNLYHIDYRDSKGVIGGIYPTYRALNRLIYQERWAKFEDFGISGPDYYSIRAISILENCRNHPLHEELVKLVLSLDKYSLGYSQDGLRKYVDLLTNGPGTGGLLNNQYGDDVRGLSSFKTVEVIRKFA